MQNSSRYINIYLLSVSIQYYSLMLPIDKQRYKNNTAFQWDGVHLDVCIYYYIIM